MAVAEAVPGLSCAWPALALPLLATGNVRRVLVSRKVYGHLAVIKAEKENKDKCLKERNERKKERDQQQHARNESEHAAYAQCAQRKLLVHEQRLLACCDCCGSQVLFSMLLLLLLLLLLQLFLFV